MTHNTPCENAKTPKCRCSGCGGSQHGWPGFLDVARGPAETRDAMRSAADHRWTTTRPQKGSTDTMRRAAAYRAIADIVIWLAEHKYQIERVDTAGKHITKTFEEVDAHAGRNTNRHSDLANIRTIIPGHFWCALLADLSSAADTMTDTLDNVPQLAADALVASDENPGWGKAHLLVTEFAANTIWVYMKPLVIPWDVEGLIRVMRILAVLICPDLAKHARVSRLCLIPLARDTVSGTAEGWLQQSFGAALEPPAA